MDDGTALTARGIFQSALQQQQQQQQAPRRTVDVGGLRARATRVSVAGASRIRPAVLDRLSHGVLAATTVGEIAQEAREAAGRLQALGIAKEARVVLDQAAAGDSRQGVAVAVALECTDGPRYSIKTEAGVDDAEGTAGVAARMANIFGGGESADIHYARGTRTQAAFQGVFAAPVDADPHRRVSIAATQRLTSHRPHSAHDETLREVGVAYRAAGPAAHDLAYSLAWRSLGSLGADASPTLRAEAGHSLKSAVRHTVAIDTRDSARAPSRGSLLRLTSEAAAAPGDARFVKARVEVQTNQPLGAGFVVSSALQAGVLWPLGLRASPLADRFFLGGAASVRGFHLHGIGPRDGGDSIGGDVFYAAGVSLLTPPPFAAAPALRGHVWANAGQLALLDARGLLRSSASRGGGGGLAASLAAAAPEARRFLVSPSAAVGVGLVYNHPVVRAELSLCLPIAAAPTDRPKPGLQFGLGLAFL
ncbi:hypothetical protein GGI11_003554 [Coemansia sp. RSA 2049]|nr:hypothetical protein H4217_005852 [Coemansia sp. RSA 1939]KAJ2516096.1 hypothetical protein GGI11_003554 [Coemansia sp. RSA 2049]KAJ2607268.1 hypothetical protein EV177_005615 [Coemansia sp. RSA 1804]KAJ2685680.1 hypothetical protein GGH99_003693 [Coemansia sp. RSA 1285]